MQSTNTDTATNKTVAQNGKKVSAVRTGTPILRGKGYDDSASTDTCSGVVNLDTISDAEGHAIMALRDWSRAAREPEFLRTMIGWYSMRTYIDLHREGKFDIEAARETMGNAAAHEYLDCIQTASYILSRLSQESFADSGTGEDTEAFADFEARELLAHKVGALMEGQEPAGLDVTAQPELHAAAAAVKAWIIANRARKGGNATK